jgi:hypothetical protein
MFSVVIYNMITRKLKSRPTSESASSRFTGMHWFLTVIGIVTAVICSIILLSDTPAQLQKQSLFTNTTGPVIEQVTTAGQFAPRAIVALF